MTAELELLDWRRQVAELYAAVRAEPDPSRGHAVWRSGTRPTCSGLIRKVR